MNKIPERVTLQPDGTYIWSAALDMDLEREGYRMGGLICRIAALILFLAGVLFSFLYRSWQPLLYTTVFALIVLLITIGVVRGQEKMGQLRCTYRLMDTLISTGSGRGTAVFEFRKAKAVIVGKGYIELRARLGAFRAYIPEEDYNFVRGYIQGRLPMECEIRYE